MMNGMRVSFLNRFLRMTAVVLAAAFAFLLAGCGGKTESAGTVDSGTGTAAQDTAAQDTEAVKSKP